MESGIPTPPTPTGVGENITTTTSTSTTTAAATAPARRSTTTGGKPTKPVHRVTKRSATQQSRSHISVHDHGPISPPSGMDNRQKRVWKACERCRMKKTKCDGEFPCKRCRDDGLICTAGVRKKMEYKQLPRGYAEVLESTQYALIATIHKLYAMVRNGQSWDLGEPGFNERGDPIVHDIASQLGCIRPNADADLPPHSVFPEDQAGLEKLAAELELQQMRKEKEAKGEEIKLETESNCARVERASSSELDHSDFELDHRKSFLGQNSNIQSLSSPASFVSSYSEFEASTIRSDIDPSASLFSSLQSPTVSTPYQPPWPMQRNPSFNAPPQYVGQVDMDMAEYMLNQGLVESEFGTIKPHMITVPNPEVMLGYGDPMIAYSGYGNMGSPRQ